MTVFNITVNSDTTCPHCYLGLHRLRRAIALFTKVYPNTSSDTFLTKWTSHRLDPDGYFSLDTSTSVRDVSAKKYGPDRVPALTERMARLGASEGLCFTFDGRIGDTRDSHRVICLARTKGNEVENRVVEELFRMFFEHGGDITAWRDLTEAAVKGGLDKAEVEEWLESGKGGDEVDQEAEAAKAAGVTGVPRFVINEEFVVEGADDVQEFLAKLAMAKEKDVGGVP